MRKIFYAVVFIASMLCFAVAQAQTPLGSYLPTVTNIIKGSLKVDSSLLFTSLRDLDSSYVLAADANGKIYHKVVATNLDTNYLAGRFVDEADSGDIYITPTQLANAIAAIPIDTVPTWQAVLNVGRVGDSVLIDSNLYIGTTAERKPMSIQVAGDSRDAVSEVPLAKIWPGRLANYLGATLNNRLAVSGSFLMNQTPRYNPLNDTGALMDIITTPGKIRNVAGLTDSVYYFIVTRGINDLHWYTMYDSGYNYTPENYGLALRAAMDSLTNWGYQVIIMGPKYVNPTSTHVVQDSVFRWIDTAKQIAADYNVPFFNAFTWQQSHGAANLLSFVDGFHENAEGHEVLFTGMLQTMGYQVERDDQKLAANGNVEFNSLTLRTADTITLGAVPAFFNKSGHIVPGGNELIRNNSTSNMPQGANINVADTIRGSLVSSRGLSGTSFRAANNTSAIRGDAATNGTIYFDPAADGTGSLVFRSLPNQLSLSSTELFTGLVMRSNIMRAATAFQGSAASNGTLYVDASQNTTGTINFRAGSTATLNTSGLLVTALNVNNNYAVSTAGVITEYKNIAPPLNRILLGTGTLFDTAHTTTALNDVSVTAITTTSTLTLAKPTTKRNVTVSGNITITLTPSVAGHMVYLFRTDATGNIVTVQSSSGNINGGTVSLLQGMGHFYWDGANWVFWQ